MRRAALLLCLAASPLAAQDSAWSVLHLRAGALANPVNGDIGDDWRAKLGGRLEVATPLSVGQLSLGLSHLSYDPRTGHPAYTATLFTLAWLSPEARLSRLRVSAGAELSDYRMDFADPNVAVGLRTEEEVMPAAVVRGRIPVTRRFALVADASYGVLMLAVHTPMTFVSAGGEITVATPGWLRDFLR